MTKQDNPRYLYQRNRQATLGLAIFAQALVSDPDEVVPEDGNRE